MGVICHPGSSLKTSPWAVGGAERGLFSLAWGTRAFLLPRGGGGDEKTREKGRKKGEKNLTGSKPLEDEAEGGEIPRFSSPF